MAGTPRLPDAGAETIVVTLPAEIDMANADRAGADLEAAFGPGVGVVVADMSGTRFCDSLGIPLVMAYRWAKASDNGSGWWCRPARSAAPPGDIHRVRNAGPQTAISLHLYGTDIGRLESSVRRIYDLPVLAGTTG